LVDRYRELEGVNSARKLDVVLMATVSSFGSLQQPTAGETRRFAELFGPVYEASSMEARRQAVAALSGNAHIPQSVCLFIARQDITISAPFLGRSPSISDDTLISIIEEESEDHTRAIIHRNDLSQRVIEALISAHKPQPDDNQDGAATENAATYDGSEALRQTLKAMAAKAAGNDKDDRLGLVTLNELQTALLVRFARRREHLLFRETLARALGGETLLANDILSDISGHRLATALVALGMSEDDTTFVLPRIFPHMALDDDGHTEIRAMVGDISTEGAIESLLRWQSDATQRADGHESPQRDKRRSA